MQDVMVSVRMPQSLATAIKKHSTEKHYLDSSEFIRSLVRKKWQYHTNPDLAELKSLTKSIEAEIKNQSIDKVRQQVNKELAKIKDRLRGDLNE